MICGNCLRTAVDPCEICGLCRACCRMASALALMLVQQSPCVALAAAQQVARDLAQSDENGKRATPPPLPASS